MTPALYQHQDGGLAIICPQAEGFFGLTQALLFPVQPWMALASLLQEASQDYDHGHMRRPGGAPWHGSRYTSWPDPAWTQVEPEVVQVTTDWEGEELDIPEPEPFPPPQNEQVNLF